ncbi:acetylglutamate kinase [Heyndrickxia sporothermodurans]|uniref:Acetylglutamate kinase n=1 Tax=Heyndrickxia sporothermodurans TaxID=46224 RepID=A0AB37H8C8_9BACI|nr:acetylglutamate kinase [Heyndrickxia sporothermodurans]MBL5771332.1 acetylglutamate kinase [Heyndrickxia sporothermodurans]MBL5775047.1 acetylglutamate kinase [Heyndrickxia sporothermodurans]MBL5792473.1 acetylglutamate kinase [Heyndrickxia sporothermodurans]MBL5796375.1 acetylglutamate kinase [Heyndrickxia sporothermodurans]MBL5807339.1 acetylglutamate kinase [Heyndrickxia sporothermodurans]
MSYIVIKCGGSVLENISSSFYSNIVDIMKSGKMKPIIVHGGGPDITTLLKKLDIETRFINGIRVTSKEVLRIVEMVLSGSSNKMVVRNIIANGGEAIGLSGIDGMLLEAKQFGEHHELGFVGEVVSVKKSLLDKLLDEHVIPVISPIAIDRNGQHWNINGDTAAAAIAREINGSLCMVTNVAGVIKEGKILHFIQEVEVENMISNQIITGGMIPKVNAAIECLRSGVKEVSIINGMDENALLKLVSGEMIGTKFMEGITC